MPEDGGERERLERDFLAEAEDIFEALAGALRDLEEGLGAGPPRPPVINAIFRQVHSLKGLAALQGFQGLSGLAHALEDLLDRLRLGQGDLNPETLDLIHEAFEALQSEARAPDVSGSAGRGIGSLEARLRVAAGAGGPGAHGEAPAPINLDARILAALSAYEEHRLRDIVRSGQGLLLVRLRLGPRDFEARLRQIVARIEARGEVICTVPLLDEHMGADLHFALLVTAAGGSSELSEALGDDRATVESVPGSAPPRGPSEAGHPAEDAGEELRGVSRSLRVPVGRLDEVLTQVGDLSIALAAVARAARAICEAHPEDRAARDLSLGIRALAPRLQTLQRSTIAARLVPVEQIFGRIGRMVARAARASGRDVDFHTLGGGTELDKAMMDELASPLVQLLRNALDHGLEPPEERERAGKPRRGRLVLSAFQNGRSAVIDVIDDGRGIAVEAVRAAARSRGLIPAGRAIGRAEAHDLIFSPGFSTAPRVSQVSGRGVGLDVVRRSIRRLKGSIEVRSVEGQGTTFTVTLPMTLALVQALIVRAAGERFAIPIGAIRETLRLEPGRLRRSDGRDMYDHPRGPLPLWRLDQLVGGRAEGLGDEAKYAVVPGPPCRPAGIVVDGFIGHQEVVIKPVGKELADLPGLAGATDLGDATAVLVLDPEGLLGEPEHEPPRV